MALQHCILSPTDETLLLYDVSAAEEPTLKSLQRAAMDEILLQMNIQESPAGFWRAGLPAASSAYFDAVHTIIVG